MNRKVDGGSLYRDISECLWAGGEDRCQTRLGPHVNAPQGERERLNPPSPFQASASLFEWRKRKNGG